MDYDIRKYGAVSGKEHDCTLAVQAAIDVCGASGGGRVIVPPGLFAVDMLTLRDNVEFHLANGAVLYSLLERIPEEGVDYAEPSFNMKRYLIGGVGLTGASVTGKGTIDGRGDVNFWDKNDGYEHPLYGQRYWPRTHRPRALIHFRECNNIRIEDITLLEPPAYNIWLLGCDTCDITGIRIRTDLHGPNNDGVDIDCCSNVYITGCDIVTNDDAIGIFSDINTLGFDKPCENIVVSDCRIMAISDGIRIGYVGDGTIRNVTISNCVIHHSMIGISMMVALSPDDARGVIIKYGPKISRINFSNLIIDSEQTFNFQSPKSGSTRPLLGYIEDVTLSNINALARRGSFFGGVQEQPLGNIQISGLHLTLTGKMGDEFLNFIPDPYPLWGDMPYDGIPYPFHIRHAKDLTIRDSVIRYSNATGSWQGELYRSEHSEVHTDNVRIIEPPTNAPALPEIAIDRTTSPAHYANCPVQKPSQFSEAILNMELPPGAHSWLLPPFPDGLLASASAEDWEKAFSHLRHKGIEEIIVPAVIWKDLYFRYYPSSRYSDLQYAPVLSRILSAAEKQHLEVCCGSYMTSAFWRKNISRDAWEKELLGLRCTLSEVRRYDQIHGFFIPLFPPPGTRLPTEWVEKISDICRNTASALKSRNDEREIVLYIPEATICEISDCDKWRTILADAGINRILLPLSKKLGKSAYWQALASDLGIDICGGIAPGFNSMDNPLPSLQQHLKQYCICDFNNALLKGITALCKSN